MNDSKSLVPTRKWFATQITAIAALVAAWLTAGAWNTTLSIALVGLIAQAAAGYLLPNADTPGGVPIKKEVATAVAG